MATKVTKDDATDAVEKLEAAFDVKVRELHDVKGGQTERHAFMYYREQLWKIRDYLTGRS